MTIAFRSLLAAACVWAGWRVVRAEVAEYWIRKGDPQAAARWEPGNSAYQESRRAVELNPHEARGWLRLGLEEEMEGRLTEAERCLLEAARRSRKYEARWALANFYFRRWRKEEFRRWAAEALEMAYADRTPLFDLCEGMGGCAFRDVEYARYLAARGEADRAAEMLLSMEKPEWVPEGLLEAARAAELWERTWPGFEARVSLDGRQAERFEAAGYWMPVEKGREYVVRCKYEAWQPGGAVRAEATGLKLVAEGQVVELRFGGGEAELRFRAEGKKARVAVVHEREAGRVRAEAEARVVCGR
ncbi:MAG: hypothetical protein FJW20_11705 [Acidimicrobiia bacterium]|nr:hypothetical protein [Acidimicrobiia bacterium]